MKSSRIAFAVIALALALVCVVPMAAPGAPNKAATSGTSAAAAAAATSAPTGNRPPTQGPIDVQIWPQGDPNLPNQALIVADVQLAPDAKLPATVRIPIASGATVLWAGEILGGNPDADPQRLFGTGKGAGGGQYAEMNLVKGRRGQIDCSGIPLTVKGDEVSFKVDWIQSTEASSALFTVRFAAGVSRVSIDPAPAGPPQTNLQGESLYSLPVLELKPGQKQTITVSYNTNPSGEVPASGPSAPLVYATLGGLLAIAIAILIFQVVKRRQAIGEDEDDDNGHDVIEAEDATPEEADTDSGSELADAEDGDRAADENSGDWFNAD